MGENSKIEWTNHTWNPWMGCTKVSSGCKNCYMFREQVRYKLDPNVVKRTSTQTWKKPLKWNKVKKAQLVFVCSWSDFFHPDADAWRDDAWKVIKDCKNLTFQILTKRPERIKNCLPKEGHWPGDYLNVWMGVSVEEESQVPRIADLIETEALVKFVSAEPLLGDLTPSIDLYLDEIDWLIVGGESGPGCRSLDVEWVRNLKNHCKFFDVPFFYKQEGGHPDKGKEPMLDGEFHFNMPHTWANESQRYKDQSSPYTSASKFITKYEASERRDGI
jgi:protein gp37